MNRTYHYWHVFVPDLTAGQIYAYRSRGPFDPERGLRFDPDKVLLDPYGKCIARPAHYDRRAARRPGDNAASAMKSVVVDAGTYDWENDIPLRTPFVKTVLYETHVRGFTKHASSGLAPDSRGTYRGLIEKIPYLKDSGRHRTRAAAGLCLRRTGRSGRSQQLLGLFSRLVFRASCGIQLPGKSPGRPRRIQGHGQGAPSCRY